jgi:hypothetical protein
VRRNQEFPPRMDRVADVSLDRAHGHRKYRRGGPQLPP